jgi:hypothetical protein
MRPRGKDDQRGASPNHENAAEEHADPDPEQEGQLGADVDISYDTARAVGVHEDD